MPDPTDDLLLADLEDAAPARTFDWSLIDRSVLMHPMLLRAVVGFVLVTLFVLWPDRGQIAVTRIAGLVVLTAGATTLWVEARASKRDLVGIASGLVGVIVGAGLLALSDQRPEVLARVLGLLLVGVAARDLLVAWRAKAFTTQLARSLAMLASGGLLLALPSQLFTWIAIGFGASWALVGAAAVSVSINPDTPSVTAYRSSHQLVDAWFADRPKRAASRTELYDKILFEGVDTTRRVTRFVVLMAFASVIASMGVITDSTAVVIGAMLIAPLMTPLMGMAISLVMGWPRRLARSAIMAAAGIAIAILTGLVLGLAVPAVVDTMANSQILARTSPTLLDLIVALAAGAAGAYALSRPDVSDSLPGVAIAISLVPPLTVVGISYSQGDWSAGNGALLLYSTNMLAILVMGGITFIVTGVTPISRVTENQHRMRTWGFTLGAAAVLIVGGLFLNGAQITQDAFAQDRLADEVEAWLEPFDEHTLVSARLEGELATVVIIGPSDEAPRARTLAGLLSNAFDRTVTADVRMVVEERDMATSDIGG